VRLARSQALMATTSFLLEVLTWANRDRRQEDCCLSRSSPLTMRRIFLLDPNTRRRLLVSCYAMENLSVTQYCLVLLPD
jgi:hypothetical protein